MHAPNLLPQLSRFSTPRPDSALPATACHSNWEGIYVLYYYAAKRSTAKAVQLLLSNPEAGSEGNVMRHITLCRA